MFTVSDCFCYCAVLVVGRLETLQVWPWPIMFRVVRKEGREILFIMVDHDVKLGEKIQKLLTSSQRHGASQMPRCCSLSSCAGNLSALTKSCQKSGCICVIWSWHKRTRYMPGDLNRLGPLFAGWKGSIKLFVALKHSFCCVWVCSEETSAGRNASQSLS